MASLFEDMAEVKVYIDDVLLITKGSFHDHLARPEEVFRQFLKARLQLNVMKCSFCALKTEYLGFVLTPKGIKPQTKRVQAILQIAFHMGKFTSTSGRLYSLLQNLSTLQKTKKYGKLPAKTHDDTILPWSTVAVDTIGPWTILQPNRSKKDKITLITLAIIDVQTCFLEIVALSDSESATVAAAFDQHWLCHYP
jgi:hypothetical protein